VRVLTSAQYQAATFLHDSLRKSGREGRTTFPPRGK
jgi:hypothetical protein